MGSNRRFGLVLVAACAVVASIRRWHAEASTAWWVAAVVLLAITLTMPRTLTPLKKMWLKLGEVLHMVVSPVLLVLFYFTVVTPIGMIMRAVGRDPLRLKARGDTYWIERVPPGPDPRTMPEPF